jgi:hypothetical protein
MFGNLGDSVSALRNSEFFDWFSLQPDAAGNGTMTFRPSGAAFHDLVALQALTGGDDTLRELRLTLARSFIDDRRNGAFALDITKSFLRSALGETPLVRDLERRLANAVDIRRADVAQPEPAPLSQGEETMLETYAGLAPECELCAGELTLQMQNEDDTLRVRLF